MSKHEFAPEHDPLKVAMRNNAAAKELWEAAERSSVPVRVVPVCTMKEWPIDGAAVLGLVVPTGPSSQSLLDGFKIRYPAAAVTTTSGEDEWVEVYIQGVELSKYNRNDYLETFTAIMESFKK